MMGPRQVAQGALFYEFSLEDHVPSDHVLRQIDRFVDLSDVRSHLAPFYSAIGRPSIDPELMIHCPAGHCVAMSREGDAFDRVCHGVRCDRGPRGAAKAH